MRVQTSYPPGFFIGKTVFVLGKPYRVLKARKRKGNVVVLKLEGVDDINEAELLRNLYLEVEESSLEPLGEGEYYVYQLIGLDVVDRKGGRIGKVVDMHEWGPYWTFEVLLEDGKVIFIPFVKAYVDGVDLERGVLEVRLPPGYTEQF